MFRLVKPSRIATSLSMHPLNMTRLAFGCDDAAILRERLEAKAAGGETWIVTRFRPTRHAELVGGSLFWIIRHQLVARQPILGFVEDEGRWRIRLALPLSHVVPRARRAHQGWRYLAGDDAPRDLAGDEADGDALPPALAGELALIGLL